MLHPQSTNTMNIHRCMCSIKNKKKRRDVSHSIITDISPFSQTSNKILYIKIKVRGHQVHLKMPLLKLGPEVVIKSGFCV